MEHSDDPETDIIQAVLELLATGPMPLEKLTVALLERDLVEAYDGGIDEVADYVSNLLVAVESTWETDTGVVASTQQVLEGRVFTHRISADDSAAAALGFGGGLELVDLGVEYGDLALEDGTPLHIDLDRMDGCQQLGGPQGWLDGFGVGDVVSLQRIGKRLRLQEVPRSGPGEAETAALMEGLEPSFARGEGAELVVVMMNALVADDQLFREPQLPISELLEQAGCERRKDFFGPADRDWEIPGLAAHKLRRATLKQRYGLNTCCEKALDIVDDAWTGFLLSAMPNPPAAPPTKNVTEAMSHDNALAAFLDGVDMSTLGADLADFAGHYRACAGPRDWGPATLAGQLAEAAGDPLEAEAAYREAINRDSAAPVPNACLGWIEFDRSHFDTAARHLGRAFGHEHALTAQIRGFSELAATADRNDPCPCGSGRKFKTCHRDTPVIAVTDLNGVLFHKLLRYVTDAQNESLLIALCIAAGDTSGQLMADTFAADVLIFEGAGLADFVYNRADLLPPEELELLHVWEELPRRLWEIVEVQSGVGMKLRDVVSGDAVQVTERSGSVGHSSGEYLMAHVCPVGDQNQLIGQTIDVAMHLRESAMALVDNDADAIEVVEWYIQASKPPSLVTRDGHTMVACKTELATSASRDQTEVALTKLFGEPDEGQWTDVGPPDDNDERVLRGWVTIAGEGLRVESMSQERQEDLLAALTDALPGAEVISDERSDPWDTLAEQSEGLGGESAGEGTFFAPGDDDMPPELQEFMANKIREMETGWLDESIPALKGATPRQAADDPTLRADLIRLLNSMPTGAGGYDPDRLRRALGLD